MRVNIILVMLVIKEASLMVSEQDNSTALVDHLLKGYDRRLAPHDVTGEPTVIDISIFMLEMTSISDTEMEYTVMVYFQQSWTDPRFRFSHLSNLSQLSFPESMTKDIWAPDIFFVNERDAKFHELSRPNRAVYISQDGNVFLTERLSLTIGCPMTLHKFPMDTQFCKLEMESFTYDTSRVRFRWRDTTPLELPKKVWLPKFNLTDYKLYDCTNGYSTGTFACLRVVFELQRNVWYHVISSFIPSTFIVIVSWVSFWISADAIPGRVTLGVTTVLTMTTQNYISALSVPDAPYIKAMDVWNTVSLLFVFSTLLEFAIVNVNQRREMGKYLKRASGIAKQQHQNGTATSDTSINGHVARSPSECYSEVFVSSSKARKVDKISRVAFPVTYVLFVIFYALFFTYWEGYPIEEYGTMSI